jgi:hypothetical protein
MHIVVAVGIVRPTRVVKKEKMMGLLDGHRKMTRRSSFVVVMLEELGGVKKKDRPRSRSSNRMLKNLYKTTTIMMMPGTLLWRMRMFNCLPNSEQCES